MPFIKQWRRDAIAKFGLQVLASVDPGDRCYVQYKKLMEAWKKEPRWTTVHNLLKEELEGPNNGPTDEAVAKILAWQVFFHRVVMPYEEQKAKKNGEV